MAVIRWIFVSLISHVVVMGYLPMENVEMFEPDIEVMSRSILDFKGLSSRTVLNHLTDALPDYTLEITDEYRDSHNGVTHIWLRQLVDGIPVHNAVGNININQQGRVISNYDRYTNASFTMGEHTKPSIGPQTAVKDFLQYANVPLQGELAIKQYGIKKYKISAPEISSDDIEVSLVLHQSEDRSLSSVWFVSVDLNDHWYEGTVCARTGQVLSIYDLVHWYTYNVYPIGTNCPLQGPRTTEPELFDPSFSPLGWHDQGGGRVFTNTQGNNVRAQENWSGSTTGWENNYRPTAQNDAFNFPIDFSQQPRQYIDATTTNLFYHNNLIHNILYQYGFDEISGNFQQNNFGRGGRENDPVIAHCQDGSGYNNANFATPADGSPGRMRMYLWNQWNPMRDGDLVQGIIYHEYAHGLSNRLCGGPTVTGCLQGSQSSGMGEGWGDFLGLAFQMREGYNRTDLYGNSLYVSDRIGRNWPYSSDLSVAPQSYSLVSNLPIHQIGAVWATMLYEIYFNLVEVYGFNPNYLDSTSGAGNIRIVQMVVDGMKFMPSRPTLVASRDAILDAALETYDTNTWCLAWCGFGRRGLGTGATSTPGNNCQIPAQCAFCQSPDDVCSF